VSVGGKHAEKGLFKCLALGADNAIRLYDKKFSGSDGFVIAKILCSAIRQLKFDLVMTGCMAADDGLCQVGPQLAQIMGIPFATLVKKLEIQDKRANVERELEEGVSEVLRIQLPAVFSIQTGIHILRYPSFRKTLEAKKKEIKVFGMSDLGLEESEVGEAGSGIVIEELFVPRVKNRGRILQGTPDETVNILMEELIKRGAI
jgi:electron transfer flavoprotein beta subunit